MCLWKVEPIQRGGLSKLFLDSKISTVSDSILLFVEKLYLDGPYNKMFTILYVHSDFIKCCKDYRGFQGVSLFVRKTRENDW